MKPFIHLLLLSIVICGSAYGETGSATVLTAKPAPSTASSVIRLPARTAPAEQAEIFSRVTGIVSERRVDIGDKVKAGDILALIEAPEIATSLARARAGLAQSNARAELARNAVERARTMSKNRVISEEVLDERESAAKSAEADVQVAQADVHRFEELQTFQTIRAPFDGTISARTIERGDHLEGDKPQAGRGLFHIVHLSELRLEVEAPPAAALRLEQGQQATVEFRELPNKSLPATVARTSSVIDPRSGTMRIELTLRNPDLTIPAGLTGTVTIETDSESSILEIPTNAIVSRDGKTFVALLRDQRVAFVPVTLGKNLGPKIEILSGLSPDDTVILSPNALLREGDPAQPRQ